MNQRGNRPIAGIIELLQCACFVIVHFEYNIAYQCKIDYNTYIHT